MHALGKRLWALSAAVALAGPAAAREYAPRVVSPHNADAYSMKTFAQFPRWRDLRGDAKAWEVFRYLADRRTGLFPLGKEVLEGRDALPEFATVRDPVKLINVYGYGYCGILGPTMAGVGRDMGLGRSRAVVLPGWGHVAAETFYDGQWHYLDLDVRAAFRRADGSLASLDDARRDPALWKGPQGPLFFPLDPLEPTRRVYEKTPVHHYYGHSQGGHTMDYVLRQGETFTRWWKPQGGRWHHLDAYNESPFPRQILEREPRGPKCKHAGWSDHAHGNGRFDYQPDLTDRSADFDDGAYDADNVTTSPGGLTLKAKGKGHAVFEVRSPYVIVPRVGDMARADDDREASVVTVDAAGAALSLSVDNGLSWKDLGPAAGGHDLTPHVRGRYGYLLRVSLEGEPGRAALRSLRMTTWVQVAPASLPSLRKGKNVMEYRTGDHHGLPTRVLEVRADGGDRDDFFRHLHEVPKDFDPKRVAGRARGAFVVKVQAPPGSRVAWLSAGAGFATHQQEAARNTRNAIAYAVHGPNDFKPLYESDVPADQAHWHYNADRELKLDEPAKVVYLRYAGDPGVNNLRIYAHCLDDRPRRGAPVTVTHAWREGDRLKTRSVTLDKPGPYEVVCDVEPEDESVTLAVASAAKNE